VSSVSLEDIDHKLCAIVGELRELRAGLAGAHDASALPVNGQALLPSAPTPEAQELDAHLRTPISAPTRRRSQKPPLPPPHTLRAILANRRLRRQVFAADVFADPAWDMLLDLAAAHGEHRRVSVTSLCIASGVAASTALRWIAQLTKVGLFERTEDVIDRRRAFVSLTDRALVSLSRYFAQAQAGTAHID